MATSTRITVMDEKELERRIGAGLVTVMYMVSLEIPAGGAVPKKRAAQGVARGRKAPPPKKKKVDCYVTTDDEVICIAH